MKPRLSAVSLWSGSNLEREIKARFSDADPKWVCEMVNFDVDTFFNQMDDFMVAREALKAGQELQVGLDTTTEVAEPGEYGPCPVGSPIGIRESR